MAVMVITTKTTIKILPITPSTTLCPPLSYASICVQFKHVNKYVLLNTVEKMAHEFMHLRTKHLTSSFQKATYIKLMSQV